MALCLNFQEEHFEDFTTASEWETFTANLERVIIEWQSRPFDPENIMQQWGVLHEKVSFAGNKNVMLLISECIVRSAT